MQIPTALAAFAAEEGTKAGNLFGAFVTLGIIATVGLWCVRKAIRIRDNAGGRLLNACVALIAFGVVAFAILKVF